MDAPDPAFVIVSVIFNLFMAFVMAAGWVIIYRRWKEDPTVGENPAKAKWVKIVLFTTPLGILLLIAAGLRFDRFVGSVTTTPIFIRQETLYLAHTLTLLYFTLFI